MAMLLLNISKLITFCLALLNYNPCTDASFFLNLSGDKECIKIIESVTSWQQVDMDCKGINGNLVTIMSKEFQDALVDKLKPRGSEDYWINLKYDDDTKTFQWQNGLHQRIPYKKNTLTVEGNRHCVSINSQSGAWTSRNCNESLPALCSDKNINDTTYGRPNFRLLNDTVIRGNLLLAVCHDYVGLWGTLTFQYEDASGYTLVLDQDNPNVTFEESYYKVHSRKYGTTCRRFMHSRLTMYTRNVPLSATSRLYCKKHEKFTSVDTNTCGYCAYAEFKITSHQNEKPTIDAIFHGKSPIVHLSRWFKLTCYGCVGQNGNLSWATKSSPHSFVSLQQWADRISYQSESRACGVYVTTELEIPVTPELDSKRVRCVSFLIDPKSKRKLHPLFTDTPALQTENGPQKPTLRVDYPQARAIVHTGQNLTATCYACVGRSGDINWSVIGQDGEPLDRWKLDSMQMTVLDRHEEYNSSECPYFVTSLMTLTVTRSLQGARLSCSSYNGKYLDGVSITDTSYEFVVFIEPDLWDIPTHVSGFIIGFFIVLVIVLAVWKIYRNEKRVTPTHKEKRSASKDDDSSILSTLSSASHKAVNKALVSLGVTRVKSDSSDELIDVPEEAELAEKLSISVEEARKRVEEMRKEKEKKERLKSLQKKAVEAMFKRSPTLGLATRSKLTRKKQKFLSPSGSKTSSRTDLKTASKSPGQASGAPNFSFYTLVGVLASFLSRPGTSTGAETATRADTAAEDTGNDKLDDARTRQAETREGAKSDAAKTAQTETKRVMKSDVAKTAQTETKGATKSDAVKSTQAETKGANTSDVTSTSKSEAVVNPKAGQAKTTVRQDVRPNTKQNDGKGVKQVSRENSKQDLITKKVKAGNGSSAVKESVKEGAQRSSNDRKSN